jgi:hypothetical protein
MNKSLQSSTVREIEKYVSALNEQGLGLNLEGTSRQLKVENVLEKFRFITYNDTRNLEHNIAQQFDALKGFENRFVVVDEAHNLFRSKSGSSEQPNENSRGQVLYKLFMTYESL